MLGQLGAVAVAPRSIEVKTMLAHAIAEVLQ
jgi:hypothetical protein